MKRFIIPLLLITFLLPACSDDDEKSTQNIVVYNQAGTQITLLDVTDERCPSDADCLWEGNAAVDLRITNSNGTEDFTLNTFGVNNETTQYPNDTTLINFNLTIELLDLQPLPLSGVTYNLSDYTVDLSVN